MRSGVLVQDANRRKAHVPESFGGVFRRKEGVLNIVAILRIFYVDIASNE